MNRLNRKQALVVVLMDLALLAALCVAVYFAQTGSEDITFVFLKTFAPTALVAVAAARIAIGRLADPDVQTAGDAEAERT